MSVKSMEEQQRWVTKAEAAEELGISLSTLDRRIKKGEIEVVREGRRVWVLMHGPEYLSDDVLLRRAEVREEELKRVGCEVGEDRIRVGASSGKPGTGAGRSQGGGVHCLEALP